MARVVFTNGYCYLLRSYAMVGDTTVSSALPTEERRPTELRPKEPFRPEFLLLRTGDIILRAVRLDPEVSILADSFLEDPVLPLLMGFSVTFVAAAISAERKSAYLFASRRS